MHTLYYIQLLPNSRLLSKSKKQRPNAATKQKLVKKHIQQHKKYINLELREHFFNIFTYYALQK